MIVADGTDEAYEAFVGLFAQPPFGPQAREWLDRHRRMVAWNNAVIINTAAGYRSFLLQYPDSDLTATARKLEDRLRNRPNIAASLAAIGGAPNASGASAAPAGTALPTNASLAAPTCPCGAPPLPLKKVDLPPKKRADPDPPKRASAQPPRRPRQPDDDVVVYRRPPPPDYYEPSPSPVPSIGIGIGLGGFGRGGGGYQGRSRGGY
jgi:hypothetical protein